MQQNLICSSPFHPGQSVFNIAPLRGKCLNNPRDGRDLQPQSWGIGQPVRLGIQLLHSYFTPSLVFILYLYFFNIIEYSLFYIMYTNYITVLYRAKYELHGENWEKKGKVLCFAKPLLFSLFQETSQDTLNLVGSSHLSNYWPQGEFGSSQLCSPLSGALAGLVSQGAVTFNPLVLFSFFSQDKQQLFLLSNIITPKVITGKWRGTPHHYFLPG